MSYKIKTVPNFDKEAKRISKKHRNIKSDLSKLIDDLALNIENKKSEKAVKAVLDALGLNYEVASTPKVEKRSFNKSEEAMYSRLKGSFEQIKLHQEGKVELRDAKDLLNEL